MSDTLDTADIGRIYGLLSECFKHPDEQFYEDVGAGTLEAELASAVEPLEIAYESGIDPDLVPESAAAFDNEYISLFEAFEKPYAPIVESVYKEWYDGPAEGGLLDGPPAENMRKRFRTIGVSPPARYQPDHLSLLLEYGAVLVAEGTRDQHRQFVEDHLDWVPAFRRRVENAAADAPFHRACVALTDEAVRVVRDSLGVEEPTTAEIDAMLDRVEAGTAGVPDEKEFRP